MVVLSPRFAALACLCAALPLALPAPVEAAHLYGSHSMEKHASSSHSHHRMPSALPTHSHDGKHHGHKAPHHRAPELPPLLRRHRVHDHMMAQVHQGQDSRDDARAKVFRSAFARSRYRREPGTHSRRSSIYVSGEHGDTYLVSRTPPRSWENGRTGTDRQSSHAYGRRQLDESNVVLGRIDIMASSSRLIVSFVANRSTQGAGQSANSTQRLASLTIDSTPIDWTSGQSTAKAFTLNASATNQTQFILMPMDEPSNAGGNFNKHVTLATEVFDESSAEMVMYCATYDPDPGSTSSLLMTPCTGETQSATQANDAADPCSDAVSSSNPHQSQIFSYDPSSGKIVPISATASSSHVDDNSDDSTGCAGARVRRDNGNSTTSGSTTPSRTSTSTAPTTSASQLARNVTLVYVAAALEVPASSPSAANTNSASTGQVAAFTTTITTTVVATVTATNPSSRTVTPAQAAVSVPISSISSTPTITTPTAPATPLRSSPSLSLSSVSTTSTSKAPTIANESLEVEVVGVAPSSTAGSSSTSSTTSTTTTTTTSSHSSVSPSLNAQAVASSVANAVVPPGRRAFVSASANVNHP